MKEIQWKTLALTDTGGTRIPVPAGGGALTLRMVPVETDACRGYAGYVSLDFTGGMSGSDTAVLVPECEDAGAYLAIVNHSPYWCRPFWGDSLRELPARTQELLLEGEDGLAGWLGRGREGMQVVATGNLINTMAMAAEEDVGCVITLDDLVDLSGDRNLCFRPLEPRLESGLDIVWKKYQVFSPAAEAFLDRLRERCAENLDC